MIFFFFLTYIRTAEQHSHPCRLFETEKKFCGLKINVLPFFVICRGDVETRADGSVWLCSAWWKTAHQMRHGSTSLSCRRLRAHWREKWIRGSPLQHSATPSVKLSMSGPVLKYAAFELLLTPVRTQHFGLLVTFEKKITWRKASQTNGNCSSLSLSWSLHWLGSLCPLCRTEDCILRTLYSEIMGPLIGWPVTEWLVV